MTKTTDSEHKSAIMELKGRGCCAGRTHPEWVGCCDRYLVRRGKAVTDRAYWRAINSSSSTS